jgi:rSAM/selenodomain-associated transferase 1
MNLVLPTILVFLKFPTAGQVKTRLAKAIGAVQAAKLYRGWIGTVFAGLQPLRGTVRVIGYYDGAAIAEFAEWHGLADEWWPQPNGDLGARLEAGFRTAHAVGRPVLAIGTDCLELDAELVREALTKLTQHDTVFGPAADGGYYLVGTARWLPAFFTGVRWSNEQTLTDHLEVCRRHHWSVGLLPQRQDIDTLEDWIDYCQRHGGTI